MTKRIYILLLFCVSVVALHAGITIKGTDYVADKAAAGSEVDSIMVVKSLEDASLVYTLDEGEEPSAFKWYGYDITGTETLLKEESTAVSETTVDLYKDSPSLGYILRDANDEAVKCVWVFLYSDYKPTNIVFDFDNEIPDRCSFVELLFSKTQTPMEYLSADGYAEKHTVKQQYLLRYDSTYFESKTYVTEQIEYFVNDESTYSLPAPLDSTTFTIMGTKYSMALGDTIKAETDIYLPFAVESHIFSSVRIRENATNERDRGEPRESQEEKTSLKGSAPLELEVLNYSSAAAYFYDWTLASDNQYKSIIAKMRDRDFRYTFTQSGKYYLRAEVSNAAVSVLDEFGCTQRKEFVIEVLESALDVPTVFTPNGDGKNDIFKVAYKSIIKFHGSIYNTWGRLVYDWDDPADGWDGTINGKPAAEGAYLYIIDATGDDKDDKGNQIKYVKKGTVSLIR